jgi:NAD(P)-dependent dehydrogenase (short-subunit alcohol dehydrogenase family)
LSRLAGRVAIVTGAGRERGIGRATALRLAADGASVVVSSQASSSATAGAHAVANAILASGGRALAVECDVSDLAQVRAMIDAALLEFGQIDAVVNNAAFATKLGGSPLISTEPEVWQRTIDVNLNGVFYVSKCAAAAMITRGKGGAIVNVASVGARVGIANHGAYCASKFAVLGLSQQMALEWAQHGIRVNSVCPGLTDTDMLDAAVTTLAQISHTSLETIQTGVRQAVPLGRYGKPPEQAAAIAFLLSDEASYITGQALNVDGGYRMD